ncbi:MAG: sigma-70 family RNA polymerase sigma factor [Cyanobacteriota bacterium]|nr:sigma-70 family RNA polymerase sigma factor [Cyanobacteriota bacterium]
MNTCTARRARSVRHHGNPSATEIQTLQLRNALVEAHRHLVPPVAHHYWRRCSEPREDLNQVGLLGLIRAAELFRPDTETPFSAFARPHIRGAILHYLRDVAAPVRLPRRQAELRSRLQQLENSGGPVSVGPQASKGEQGHRLGMSEEQWELLRRHRQMCRPAPLDALLIEQLSSPALEPQEEEQGSQKRIEELLEGLDPRTQQVLRRVVLQGWSYRRTAAALNVSAMTVQRCLHSGLANLRHKLCPVPQAPRTSSGQSHGLAPSVAEGWPSRHSPLPTDAPIHRARR